MIGALFRLVFETLVHCTAAFFSAVLSHDDVQAAGARMMVRAMNEFLRQPDLNEHVRCMSETMSKNQEDYARSAGQDFPKLAGHFIQGVFSPKKNQQQQGGSSKQQQQQAQLHSNNNDNNCSSSHNPSPSSSRTSSPASTPPFRKHIITEIMKPQKSNSFLSIPALVGGGNHNNHTDNSTGNQGLRQRLGSGGARA